MVAACATYGGHHAAMLRHAGACGAEVVSSLPYGVTLRGWAQVACAGRRGWRCVSFGVGVAAEALLWLVAAMTW